MHTHDEIKKGLECCKEDECFGDRENCPYTADPKLFVGVMCADALALIQQLEAELEDMTARYKIADDCAKKKGEMNEKLYAELATVKAERDAAVADITRMVQEPYDPCYCDYCKLTEEECAKSNCRGRNAFEWRGVQKEATT